LQPRTSLTHPLQIAPVTTKSGCGQIGITFCPGKYDPNAMTGVWARNLAIDLAAIKQWGAVALVTLVEDWELKTLRVESLGSAARELGLEWFHLPIVDGQVPDAKFETQWDVASQGLLKLLSTGQSIAVHCKGGLGRAGTIAARLLVEMGITPCEAISRVRNARQGAIETIAQEQYVLSFASKHR
jgi:ADP-ribosyl-[dinitrogen reductase] hydrolase